MAKSKDAKVFLVVWDMYGLESLLDIGQMEQQRQEAEKMRMWTVLGDPESRDPGNQQERRLSQQINMLIMRARTNSQRHYEIYIVHCDPDVREDQIRDMFEADPQSAAELIRLRGQQVYSDRLHREPVIT